MTKISKGLSSRKCAQCNRVLRESSFDAHVKRQHFDRKGFEMRQERNDLIILIQGTPEGKAKQNLRRQLVSVAYEAWKERVGL